MKRYNIFLNETERQKLNHIKKVHNLSFSTIIDIIIEKYFVFEPYRKDILNFSKNLQFLTKNRKKTSIKIKNIYNLTDRQINGALIYYTTEQYKSIKDNNLTEEQLKKIHVVIQQSINKKFQTTIDEWANYNAFCRMKERYQRENA